MARWTYANVLSLEAGGRRLWQFSPGGDKFTLAKEFTAKNGDALPDNLVAKDWSNLWQPKLNVAWLPPEKVFLRVIQVPAADFAETVSMVELQLEKISPLPVAQIVWTIEVLPKKEEGLQSVIVVIVPRGIVEETLGQLEEEGYMADRLETPMLDQLLATQATADGVWIYPGETNTSPCLIAWWYGGILRNVTMLMWSGGVEPQRFKEQLAQMSWSGELEGWLNAPPRWHLVADASAVTFWEPLVREVAGENVEVIAPFPTPQLAAMSARRATRASTAANLLPAEYSTRYRQQFIDRLWMRGLFALIMVYMAGVVVYFSALLVVKYQLNRVQVQINSITPQYESTVQVRERVRTLREQANLKLAALECWKTASDNLPQEMSLTRMNFKTAKGGNVLTQTLTLYGTVSQENRLMLTEYYETMLKATINGAPMRLNPLVEPSARPGPGGTPTIFWSIVCNLNAGAVR